MPPKKVKDGIVPVVRAPRSTRNLEVNYVDKSPLVDIKNENGTNSDLKPAKGGRKKDVENVNEKQTKQPKAVKRKAVDSEETKADGKKAGPKAEERLTSKKDGHKSEKTSKKAAPKSEETLKNGASKSEEASKEEGVDSEESSNKVAPESKEISKDGAPKPEKASKKAAPKSKDSSKKAGPKSKTSKKEAPESEKAVEKEAPESGEVSKIERPKSKKAPKEEAPKSEENSEKAASKAKKQTRKRAAAGESKSDVAVKVAKVTKGRGKKKIEEPEHEDVEPDSTSLEKDLSEEAQSAAVNAKKQPAKAASDGANKKAQNKEKIKEVEEPKVAISPEEAKLTPEDLRCDKLSKNGNAYNLKICSWNVDGYRAWINKKGHEFLKSEKPDILCLQEIRCPKDKLPSDVILPEYHDYWYCGDKDGYAGVALFSKMMPLNISYGLGEYGKDEEGRALTAEFSSFYVICTYVPNAGRGLVTLPKRLEWNEALRQYIKELDKKKPVILCGDMNVAHNEIDLKNPKTNKKNAGFTPEERQGMTDLLSDGFVDSFRQLYPDKTDAFTFWTYMRNARSKNIGWRLDYFILSERIMDDVCDQELRTSVKGSDHCPLTLFLYNRSLPSREIQKGAEAPN